MALSSDLVHVDKASPWRQMYTFGRSQTRKEPLWGSWLSRTSGAATMMRQSVMLSDLEVPGSDSASTVVLNHMGALASSAAPPSPLWRAALALAAADDESPVSAPQCVYLLIPQAEHDTWQYCEKSSRDSDADYLPS